jgi:hypothetical protein
VERRLPAEPDPKVTARVETRGTPAAESASVLWRRLDRPGHEACRVARVNAGWRLSGSAAFAHEGTVCSIGYSIDTDPDWNTRSGSVSGWLGAREIRLEISCDESQGWRINGERAPAVDGCRDLDLNFSPSTNLLPIRRLSLAVGQQAAVRAAWLRFPRFELEPLDQIYLRSEPLEYRYESGGGRFVAAIRVDENGLVSRYPGFWESDPAYRPAEVEGAPGRSAR